MTHILEERTSNGVPVAVVENPAMSSVTWSVWIGGGSRHESASEVGATHMLEHLAMAGGGADDSYAALADGLGGDANALTSKHHVVYLATVARDAAAPVAQRLVANVLRPTITTASVQRERAIVDTELRTAAADPKDYVYDRWAVAALGRDPFVRPTGGTPASIAPLTPEIIQSVHRDRVHAGNVRVVATGALALDEALSIAERSPLVDLEPGDWYPDKHVEPLPAAPEVPATGDGDTGLTVVMMGGVGPGATEPAGFAAAAILNALIGGSSASLFFRRIRLELALAYECQSDYRAYKDFGLWRTSAVVDPAAVDTLHEESCQVLARLCDHIPSDELDRARREALGRHQTERDRWLEHMMWIGEALDTGWSGDIDATFLDHLRHVDTDTIAATLDRILDDGLVVAAAGDLASTPPTGRHEIR